MISIPMKGILSSTGNSIVNDRLGCRPFRVVRNTVAASVFGILARVSSTYLLYKWGIKPSRVSFSSRLHMKTFVIRGPRGEPIATPSVCSYNSVWWSVCSFNSVWWSVIWANAIKTLYNIASRATKSNSVYVSVFQISTVLAGGVRKSHRQKFLFSREQPLLAWGEYDFATIMDTNRDSAH